MSIWKTLRITFSLRNTYRVNSILHALKQIPLVGGFCPRPCTRSGDLKFWRT